MKLTSIRAYGFKSFADKMEMDFKTPITAIVGPNGSGKSNIVDAIRWVLGEQSSKSLRSSTMCDVIFAGSETRSAFKRAEVSLAFDNSDHTLNTDLNDVEVKRVLYASGESEYYLNNQKVRLKDVTNIFMDAGITNDGFNIISQGNIETIVNAKAEDRREIIENAAHVLKYKTRKEESLHKLEKTKDNIEKISLVTDELSLNVLPLKAQSEIAQKYIQYRDELENIEISLTTYDISMMKEKYDVLKNRIEEYKSEKDKLAYPNENSETDKLNLELIKVEEDINRLQKQNIELNEQIAKLNSDKTLFNERQKYQTNETKINSELVRLKEEEIEAKKNVELTNMEYQDILKQTNKIDNELRGFEEKNSILKIKYQHLNEEIEEKTKEKFILQNKIDILETNIDNDSSLPYAVKNVLNHPRLKGIHNTIGKLIEVKDEYMTAIDIALSGSSNFIVVDDEKSAKEAISYLKENHLGRATFFPLNVIKSRYIPNSVIDELKGMDGYIGMASDLVHYESVYDAIIKNQLGNVIVARDMDSLNRMGKETHYQYRIVSLDGELLHAGGSLTGGSIKTSNSSLKDKQSLQNNKIEMINILNQLTHLDVTNKEYQNTLEDYQDKILTLSQKKAIQDEIIHEKESKLAIAQDYEKDVESKIKGAESLKKGSIEEEMVSLMKEISDQEYQRDLCEKELGDKKNRRDDISARINELEQQYRERNRKYNEVENELKKDEIELGKYDTKMDYALNVLSEIYHLTYEKAHMDYPLELEPDIARSKVNRIKKEMNELGEVNLGSIAEYERVNTRYEFLMGQKEDLEKSSEELLKIISEMDQIMVERLQEAFDKIQKEFSIVFKKMFQGGSGKLVLTDPEHILETGIDIVAEPPGKTLNNIQLLSGGEKTLTAISLLFAILNVYPVPFCILDEVEAALDDANVDTFGQYLQEQSSKSEFILITHKKKTMEYANTLYGITMQEQGVSKIVSVKMD